MKGLRNPICGPAGQRVPAGVIQVKACGPCRWSSRGGGIGIHLCHWRGPGTTPIAFAEIPFHGEPIHQLMAVT